MRVVLQIESIPAKAERVNCYNCKKRAKWMIGESPACNDCHGAAVLRETKRAAERDK